MSEERKQSLIITAYEGRETANEVYKTVRQLEKDRKVDLKAAMVILRKKNGKLKVVQKRKAVSGWGGAALGTGLALLLGAATGGVLAGAVIGGVVGGFGRKKRHQAKGFLEAKLGVDDSALAVLINDADWEAVRDLTEQYSGEIMALELTDQAAMQVSALAANEEVADAIAEEVEMEEDIEE